MLNGLVRAILFGNPAPFPDVVEGVDELYQDGLTMGTLIFGRPGTGKTSWLARVQVDNFKKYPDRAIFILDWSGSITDNILQLILTEPREVRNQLVQRLVYDDLGNPEIIVPMPEFSSAFAGAYSEYAGAFTGSYEEQIQRVVNNYTKLEQELTTRAPILGGVSIKTIGAEIFRVVSAIQEDYGTWQATEAKKLLMDSGQLRLALERFGQNIPLTKSYFEKEYLSKAIRRYERELRTYSLRSFLGVIENRETRAKIGYHKPGWTPREAIEKGLMVLVDGSRLINQKPSQHYLFTQAYSLIMQEINRRIPGNSLDKPVSLVMDEVYSLLSIPGMAEEVGMLAPLYRSRKLQLFIVLQALSQLAENLRRQIWSIGNIVCFGVSNFDEAYDLSQQLFKYVSDEIKIPARSDIGQPIVEPDRGQYLKIANTIQRLKHRECIMRRFETEKVLEKYISYIPQTKANPEYTGNIDDLKNYLLRQRGVGVAEALQEINSRNLSVASGPSSVRRSL